MNLKISKTARIAVLLAVLAVLGSLYGMFVFSNIPVIKKWRTIYIETAMTTMTWANQ